MTDADLVLGYLDPDNFAGGSMRLDLAAAQKAIREVADRLKIGLYECASGIAKIVEFQMADLIRKATIQKGFDPRDFVLFAFGGAGPVHAAVFARELGIQKVIIPQRETASVWCAFGAAASDILHVDEKVEITASPFDPRRVAATLRGLRERGAAQLERDGVGPERQRFQFSLDMRHRGQINEVEVEIAANVLEGRDLSHLHDAFVERYELLYGQGASLPGASLEIVTFRCRATAPMPKPTLSEQPLEGAASPAGARRPERPIHWPELARAVPTRILDGAALRPGNRIEGPAVVETEATSVVVHPGQRLTVDAFGDFELEV